MNEEFKGGPKNKWSRIYRKKWFFPAVYLTLAALLLSVVVWFQNQDNEIPDASDKQNESSDYTPVPNEDAQPVIDQQELIQMPVEKEDEAVIVTKFFDYDAKQEDQENALVLYNNRFYQSTGVAIATADAEAFDVLASLSGTVEEVKEDPLLGNVVILSHEDEVKTYYASLGEISVTAGSKVKQGEKIGVAGKNLFGKDNGTHVHFEIRKNGKEVNPEQYFQQPVGSLKVADEGTEETTDNSLPESEQVTDPYGQLEEGSTDGEDAIADDEDTDTEEDKESENEDGQEDDSKEDE